MTLASDSGDILLGGGLSFKGMGSIQKTIALRGNNDLHIFQGTGANDTLANKIFIVLERNSGHIFLGGKTHVPVLQITGGSDLAEPFAVVEPEGATGRAEPGMVVVIDPEHPGRLKVATEPYDRKVAGIISGANGLSPGMVMKAEGVALLDPSVTRGGRNANPGADSPIRAGSASDRFSPRGGAGATSEHNVALAGRVWCWCDAAYGPIEPGDRLTTSATVGHAMKVKDTNRAPGAVIGKAMTPLESGKGLVLVLVQPQ